MPHTFVLKQPTGGRQTLGAALSMVGMAATVGGALAFQHIGGYIPCALCLEQRTPYYVAIPIAFVALISALRSGPAILTRLLLVAVGVAMLYAAYLGVFHAGVEWRWWAGPTDCGAVAGFDMGGDLLSQLDTVRGPSCEDAALRILGLSLAGWNAIAALILAAISLRAGLSRGDRFSAH
jgi:disulfide bond formation protein DsbB